MLGRDDRRKPGERVPSPHPPFSPAAHYVLQGRGRAGQARPGVPPRLALPWPAALTPSVPPGVWFSNTPATLKVYSTLCIQPTPEPASPLQKLSVPSPPRSLPRFSLVDFLSLPHARFQPRVLDPTRPNSLLELAPSCPQAHSPTPPPPPKFTAR